MKTSLTTVLFCLGLIACTPNLIAEPAPGQAIETFIQRMSDEHGFDRDEVTRILAEATDMQDTIRERFQRSAERTWTWGRYRKNFINEARIRNGLAFWQAHAPLFEQAEREYGIPQSVLAAIVGVETNYGRNAGRIRVLDTLYTQAFFMPESERRTRFGRRELESFLVLTKQERIDPLSVKGSYAGAMGQPQFIASSYLNYAVDFDHDGQRDLWQSTADVIGSVANYFHRHNWHPGEAVTVPVSGVGPAHASLVTGENERPRPPKQTVGGLRAAGIEVPAAIDDTMPVSLVELTDGQDKSYWAALHNLYVITRYNHSYLYAMAVHHLSERMNDLYRMEQQHAEATN